MEAKPAESTGRYGPPPHRPFPGPRPLANLVVRSPGAASACASAHVRRIWGDLDGWQRLPAQAPARTASRSGGRVVAMTRASSQPPAVVLDVLGRRVRVEAGGHPSAAQVDALWSR